MYEDWLLTEELRCSLRSTGGGSNASVRSKMIDTCRDGIVATAIRAGHIMHRSMYRQYKDVDDDYAQESR